MLGLILEKLEDIHEEIRNGSSCLLEASRPSLSSSVDLALKNELPSPKPDPSTTPKTTETVSLLPEPPLYAPTTPQTVNSFAA